MTRSHSKARRALLALIGLAALPATPVAAQPAIRIEGGVPQRLPLTTIDDLDIVQPAQIDEDPVDLAVLTLGAIDVPSGRLAGVDALLLDGAPYRPYDQSRAVIRCSWCWRAGRAATNASPSCS